MVNNYQFEQADLRNGDDDFYRDFAIHLNRLREEASPEDPPTKMETVKHRFQNIPEFMVPNLFAVREVATGEIVASGGGFIITTGQNEHICQVDIRVEAPHRRQGIGRELFQRATTYAAENGRRLLLFNTNGTVPAGAEFMEYVGAQKALEASINQLALADVDRDMIRRWIERSSQKAEGIELGLWEGPYPDDQLDRVVALLEVMDSQPLDDLEVEDMKFSAEQIRELENAAFSDGVERWTLYARDIEKDQMVGYTELYTDPNNPKVLKQDNTGVFPEYRGKGIGRWLKAAMIEKVFAENQEAEFIRTGNADSNAPMLKINHELGFKKHKSQTAWQMPIEKAQAYLE